MAMFPMSSLFAVPASKNRALHRPSHANSARRLFRMRVGGGEEREIPVSRRHDGDVTGEGRSVVVDTEVKSAVRWKSCRVRRTSR